MVYLEKFRDRVRLKLGFAIGKGFAQEDRTRTPPVEGCTEANMQKQQRTTLAHEQWRNIAIVESRIIQRALKRERRVWNLPWRVDPAILVSEQEPELSVAWGRLAQGEAGALTWDWQWDSLVLWASEFHTFMSLQWTDCTASRVSSWYALVLFGGTGRSHILVKDSKRQIIQYFEYSPESMRILTAALGSFLSAKDPELLWKSSHSQARICTMQLCTSPTMSGTCSQQSSLSVSFCWSF